MSIVRILSYLKKYLNNQSNQPCHSGLQDGF